MYRPNYGTLKRIINNNFAIDSFERNTRCQGHLIAFENHNNENYVDNIRVVLVEGVSYESEQGIHLSRLDDKSQLESALVNAINTAIKDGFSCIWIHVAPKPNAERKASRIRGIQNWIESDRNREIGYNVSRLVVDPTTTLESMNEAQLELVSKLISGAYQSGASSSREFWSPKYHAFRKELEKRGATMEEVLELSNTTRGA